MLISRLAYRTRQFWNALAGSHIRVETEALLPHLTPFQIDLFRRMQVSEQVHAFKVLEYLKAGGQNDPNLLAAALLHDVGKALYPPTVLDRVIVVLGSHFFRKGTARWSEGTPAGLRRPFVVAAHHPAWGADLAIQAGASPRTVELIRRHHDPLSSDNPLLIALQAADDTY
jgi:HD domain.